MPLNDNTQWNLWAAAVVAAGLTVAAGAIAFWGIARLDGAMDALIESTTLPQTRTH